MGGALPPSQAGAIGRIIVRPARGPRARATALAIGFTKRAGSKSRAWIDRLEKDFGDRPGFAAYGVAVLAGVPPLFRGLALDGVKNTISDGRRDGFLVALKDEAGWEALVGYESTEDSYVLVLNAQGDVIAESRGPIGEASYGKIAGEIVRVLSSEGKEH